MTLETKISNPKASFNEYYHLYSPQPYVQALLKETQYTLPFDAMQIVSSHLKQLDYFENLNVLFLGSGHGTEVAALKYGYSYEKILQHWLASDPKKHIFSEGNSNLTITMVDINEAPLRFAYDVGLCQHFHICDLTNPWPEKLSTVVKNDTDLLVCVGATTYIGLDNFKHLIKLIGESNVKHFYFSLASFICDSFLEIFDDSNLHLKKLGHVRQRNYKNDEERLKITSNLKLQNRYSNDDEDGLTASIYIASQIA
ncbi:hypothetical protein QGP82_33185 [Leptothoe sp. LEGE 181152]|nr:hypothetical protein [Leptothoe sp. LEGE 181152]